MCILHYYFNNLLYNYNFCKQKRLNNTIFWEENAIIDCSQELIFATKSLQKPHIYVILFINIIKS